MNKITFWLSQLNKISRIGFTASIIWLLIFFLVGFSEANGYGAFNFEEFFSIFILVGLFPVILGWCIRWIRSAK